MGEGALLNLFASVDIKEQQGIDYDELALGYGETHYGKIIITVVNTNKSYSTVK